MKKNVFTWGLSAIALTGCASAELDDDSDEKSNCTEGQTECNGTCVDLDSDGENCGSCENGCLNGNVCSVGECRMGCDTGLEQCGLSCVDFDSSARHCGECFESCGEGICSDGTCSASGSGGTASGGSSSSGGSGAGSSGSGGKNSAVGGSGSPPTAPEKFVGNITTGDQVDAAGKKFSTHWDQITPENAGKWGSVQWNAGNNFNWGTLDAIYGYAEDNNIIFKQHAFVWGEQQPSGNVGENDVKNWIKAFCERYPKPKLIDVVNEPPPHTYPNYVNSIGGGTDGDWKWITNSFIWARESCPGAILILNDYNNIEWSGDSDHFINIVNTVLEAGAPVDAVGAQAHDLDHDQVTTATMKQLLANLHNKTGLPVYITEYDISTRDDNAQLNKYQDQIPHFLETDYVHGITIWGWVVGQTWSKAPDSGLINQNGSSRPAMTWLMETLGRPNP